MAEAPFQPDQMTQQLTPEEIQLLLQLQAQQGQLQAPPLQMPEGGPTGLPDAGLGPVTPDTMAGQPNAMASPFQPSLHQDMALDARQGLESLGMPSLGDRLQPQIESGLSAIAAPSEAQAGLMGKVRQGVQDFAADPSLSNAGALGVHTGAAAMSPGLMLAGGAVGLGDAAARQFGNPFIGEAEAQQRGKGRQAAPSQVPELPGLPPEHKPGYESAMRRILQGDFKSGAERRALEDQVKMYREMVGQAAAGKREQQQGEYDRRVKGAEAARDQELARDRRWSDTPIAKFQDKLGGWDPFLAALGAGGAVGKIQKMTGGHATSMMGKAWQEFSPFIAGSAAAFGVNNVADGYNAGRAEPDNPRKRAMEAYGQELPEGHERKQPSLDAAKGMPSSNPVRDAAVKNLTDPEVMKSRAAISAIEGLGSPVVAGLVRGKATAAHAGVSPAAQNARQRASAAASGREAKAAFSADIERRVADPATAQWFADNPGKGVRAYNAAHGTAFKESHLGRIKEGVEARGRDAALDKAAADIGGRVTREQAAQLRAAVPELGKMSPEAIQAQIRKRLPKP